MAVCDWGGADAGDVCTTINVVVKNSQIMIATAKMQSNTPDHLDAESQLLLSTVT